MLWFLNCRVSLYLSTYVSYLWGNSSCNIQMCAETWNLSNASYPNLMLRGTTREWLPGRWSQNLTSNVICLMVQKYLVEMSVLSERGRQAEVRVMTPFPILYFLPQSAIIFSYRHTQNHVHCEWSHSVNGKIPEYSSSPYGSVGTCDCSVSSYPDDICCGFAFQTGLVSLLESMAGSITVSNHLTSLTPQSDMHVCVCLDIVIVVVWMTHPPPHRLTYLNT